MRFEAKALSLQLLTSNLQLTSMKLHLIYAAIFSAKFKKILVSSHFLYTAVSQYNNPVCVSDSGKSVGNNKGSLPFNKIMQPLLDLHFRFGIKGRCCLIKYKYRGIFKDCPCNGQPLPLPEIGRASCRE